MSVYTTDGRLAAKTAMERGATRMSKRMDLPGKGVYVVQTNGGGKGTTGSALVRMR